MDRQTQFTRRILIRKNINEVFDAWTKQGGMETWFLKSAKFIRNDKIIPAGASAEEGDRYEWIWHTWPGNTQKGTVTAIEPSSSFSFTFDPAGHVKVDFEAKGDDQTEVVIHQHDINTEGESWYHYFYGCSLGWSFWLVNLKSYLEHNIVLDQRDILYDDERHMQIVNQ